MEWRKATFFAVEGNTGQWIVNGEWLRVVVYEPRKPQENTLYRYSEVMWSYGRHRMAIEGITLPSLIGVIFSCNNPYRPACIYIYIEMGWSIFRGSKE